MAGETNQFSEGHVRGYLSPQEFSRLSGLSLATVHRYLKKGRLPYRQPAGPRGRILIPADVLEAASPGAPGKVPSDPAAASAAPGTNQPQETPERRSGPPPKWTRFAERFQAKET